ncbi:MAG: hypothetical protein UT33_C0011G0175 [Candidatus Peregrinibacteria bacterium GW2011_GWC2_39_14]|nr:MAG: hypothetical protein UT33_C0011G0175 [Candidatus Peregrinibacteria bacterium GW2011_GWC2_39_14]
MNLLSLFDRAVDALVGRNGGELCVRVDAGTDSCASLINVVWLESCVLPGRSCIDGVILHKAATCADAVKRIVKLGDSADGLLVNPLAPQGGWDMEHLHQYPGLALLREFRGRVKKVAIYAPKPVVGDLADILRSPQVHQPGGVPFYDHFTVSLGEVIEGMFDKEKSKTRPLPPFSTLALGRD